ncbi:MAG: hypothetical protein C4582_05475 [Desulfobacteraceae bacterium]|nr:MAG: hypothetical protein C4582_05475 [Desulfobacteraceae bacterium]
MEYLSSGKILIVDLASSETREEELDEGLISKRIGGAGINNYLYNSYKDYDPIVLGAGILTGTLYPASDLSVLTARSPVTDNVCHCPVTLKAGIEFKYCGFDYLVVLGASAKPVFLWIHDGVADISDGSGVWGKDVWQTTDAWRRDMGDDLIQTLVIGKAGETGSDLAQVSVNYWGSGDVWGFASIFGKKRLKGIAMRGMGLLEIEDPEGFVEESMRLLESVKTGPWKGRSGLYDLLVSLGKNDVADWVAPLVHRNSASYNVPYAGNTFVYLDEDPSLLKEPQGAEPGLLLTSPYGLIAAKDMGLSAMDACRLIRSCLRYGIDPEMVALIASRDAKKRREDIESSMDSLERKGMKPWRPPFSPMVPRQPVFADFGVEGEPGQLEQWWLQRQALAYVFGIDPLFLIMSPELTAQSMIEAVRIGSGIEISEETLDGLVSEICGCN